MAGERLPARFSLRSQLWFRWTGKCFETATSHMQTVRHNMNKTLRHKLSIGILTLFLTQIGFSQSIDKFVDSTIKVDSLNVPTEYGQSYFPKEMFPEVEQNWIKTKKG